MAARRIYSDSSANAIVQNIMSMLNGSPEEAMAQAQIARQVADVDKMRGEMTARDSLANVFSNFTDPAQIAPNAGSAFGEAFRAGEDPSRVAAALLGYAANAGGDNNIVARSYVGSGHAIRPQDAFTVPRQNELAIDEERQKDEAQRSALVNAFNMNEADNEAANDRFNRAPLNVAPGHTVYRFNPDGTREEFVGSPRAASAGPSAVPLDVDPNDFGKMGLMLDGLIGKAQMPPELRQEVLLAASNLYQKTRNAPASLAKALSDIAQIEVEPGWFSNSEVYKRKGGAAPSPPGESGVVLPLNPPNVDGMTFAPAAPAEVFTQPNVTPDADPSAALPQGNVEQGGAGVEGEIQRNKKTGEMRIMRNGQWQPYQQ
jgi:hypothetical protein